MQQKELSLCLKVLDAVITLGCLWLILYFLPHGGYRLMSGALDFAPFDAWPVQTMVAAFVAATPVATVGIKCWFIFTDIGNDKSFTVVNARRLRTVSIVSLVEAVVFIVIAAICSFVQILVPGMLIVFLICTITSFALSIVGAALSHLTLKAALIQDENDLTV